MPWRSSRSRSKAPDSFFIHKIHISSHSHLWIDRKAPLPPTLSSTCSRTYFKQIDYGTEFLWAPIHQPHRSTCALWDRLTSATYCVQSFPQSKLLRNSGTPFMFQPAQNAILTPPQTLTLSTPSGSSIVIVLPMVKYRGILSLSRSPPTHLCFLPSLPSHHELNFSLCLWPHITLLPCPVMTSNAVAS